jgi:hypothetical protein
MDGQGETQEIARTLKYYRLRHRDFWIVTLAGQKLLQGKNQLKDISNQKRKLVGIFSWEATGHEE